MGTITDWVKEREWMRLVEVRLVGVEGRSVGVLPVVRSALGVAENSAGIQVEASPYQNSAAAE